MAYDEALAARIRKSLDADSIPFEEKKMFGGLTFMVNGHMCCGVLGKNDKLVLHLGKEGAAKAIAKPHVDYCNFTGTPMTSMVWVDREAVATPAKLKAWLKQAAAFAMSEPPKQKKRKVRSNT